MILMYAFIWSVLYEHEVASQFIEYAHCNDNVVIDVLFLVLAEFSDEKKKRPF